MSCARNKFAAISLLLITSSSACSAEIADDFAKQAAEQFKKGNVQEAASLQEKALSQTPKNWLTHANMSFYAWQQGNIIQATAEGETALKLAPKNYVTLTNLALIREGLEECVSAMGLYKTAAKIAPDKATPVLGIARCLSKIGKTDDCLATLKEMGAKTGKNFEWYYELADTYIRLSKPELALEPAEKASKLARSAEEKKSADILSMLVFLQTNQAAKAETLKTHVFNDLAPNEQQLYVRSALLLLAPNKPSEGNFLLDAALKNLTTDEDAETFYRIGKAFEQKADAAEAKPRTSWIEFANKAFNRAIELAPERPKYYLALAESLDQLGKLSELEVALNKVKTLQNWDTLAPFLLAELSKAKAEKGNALAACPTALDEVKIRVNGLNCGCHMGKVIESLNQVEGVGYVFVPTNVQPYEGILLIDQSKTSVANAFAKTVEKTKAIYASMVPPVVPELVATSTKKLSNLAQVIEAAQLAEYGSITNFYTAFKAVVPFEPVQELSTASGRKPTL